MDTFRFELARPEDRETVASLRRQVHALHAAWRPDIFQMEEDLYPEECFLEDIQEKRIYTAKLEDRIVGYLVIQIQDFQGAGIVPRRVLMLEELAVERSSRGQGIGSRMMEEVHALAKTCGCNLIKLGVYPENEAALALYRKFGLTIRNINMQCEI